MPTAAATYLILGVRFLSTLSAQQIQNSGLEQVMAEALKPSPLETDLRGLTDEIGGRVPGTPAMQQAVDWEVAAVKIGN